MVEPAKSIPRPLKPLFVDCSDDTVEFRWLCLPEFSYNVQFREVGSGAWTEKALTLPTLVGEAQTTYTLAHNTEGEDVSREAAYEASVISDMGSHRLTGLKPKTTYEVRVYARRVTGECSQPSSILTVDTQAKLGWFDRLFFKQCSHVCRGAVEVDNEEGARGTYPYNRQI
jgi:hypothetical protein